MPRLRTHPGEVLAEEYMIPLGLSANALGQAIGVAGNRISEIVRGAPRRQRARAQFEIRRA